MLILQNLNKNYNIALHSKWWDRGIDFTTFVWMILFVGSMVGIFGPWAELAIWVTFPIFVLDLVVAYLRIRNFKLFLKKHWFTILITIPWLRVFRVARTLRVLRAARAAKGVKGIRAAKAMKITKLAKTTKTLKMAKSSKSLKIAKSMKQTTKLSKVTKGATKSSKFKQILDFSTYISYAQAGGEFYASTSRFLRPVMKSRVYTFIAGRLLNNFRN
jgi:hypothetical protein